MARLTIAEAGDQIRKRKVSSSELTSACLKRIEQLNPKLNAFITVMADRAVQDAKAADQDIANGKWRGPLHGIPIALKDNIDTAGVRTTAASGIFKERVPTEDAAVGRKAEGIVVLTGGAARILDGVELLDAGRGQRQRLHSHAGGVHRRDAPVADVDELIDERREPPAAL